MDNSERLTVDAKACFQMLGISKNAGYQLIKANSFPLKPLKLGRKLVFSKAEINRLLNQENKGNG
jgi:predicted DNA-binding transcriptional regulator AlpA